jgi:hypothetical protein
VNGAELLLSLAARVNVLEDEVTQLTSVWEDVTATDIFVPPIPTGVDPVTGEITGPTPNPAGHGAGRSAGETDTNAAAAAAPKPVEPFFDNLLAFVQEGFAPVYCRATSPTLRWCAQWWDHAEALYRLEALWRTWELYRLEPRLGIASWLRDYLDPQLAALMDPTGPFAQCTDERHSPVRPLRTAPPPEGYFDL